MDTIWNGIKDGLKLLFEGDPLVLDAAWRSIWVSVTAVFIASILGISIGTYLARHRFRGHRAIVIFLRGSMGVPTVLIGLIGYALLSRNGILGDLDMLFTSWGIVFGECLLALPIIVSLTHGSLSNMDNRIPETAMLLGVSNWRRWRTYLNECRLAVTLAILTAFARCFTELGIAVMVGGNLKMKTRTLSTSTALETAKGDFSRAVAMSFILLAIAILVTIVIGLLNREDKD